MAKAARRATLTDEKTQKAKRLFYAGLFDLSWRLGLAILLPTLAGAFLDGKLDKDPLFTVIGLLAGFGIAAMVIRGVVIKTNKETDV